MSNSKNDDGSLKQWLSGIIAAIVSGVIVHYVTEGRESANAPTSAPVVRRFENPTHRGRYVDYCLTFARDCGEPAATAWCQINNFDRAVRWQVADGTGNTALVGSNQVCDNKTCDSFSEITCEKARS